MIGPTMKGNRNQENNEIIPCGNTECHADKDTMEQNPHFQKQALHEIFLMFLFRTEGHWKRLVLGLDILMLMG